MTQQTNLCSSSLSLWDLKLSMNSLTELKLPVPDAGGGGPNRCANHSWRVDRKEDNKVIQLTTLFFSEAYSAFPPSNCQNTSDSLPSWTSLNSAESEIRFSTSLAKCCSSPMLFFPTHKKLACALLSKKTSLVLRDCANGATYWLKQVLFSDPGHDLNMRSLCTTV